mgnify:CR=1 FL=1
MSSAVQHDPYIANCLIIDSCDYNNERLIQLLEDQDDLTFHCSPFDQATELIDQQSFDLILLHTCHTDTSALSELHYLRQQSQTTPIIVFDEHFTQERADEFIYWRASDYLELDKLNRDTLNRSIRHANSVRHYLTEIDHLIRIDPLTGMTNRQQFHRELSNQLKALVKMSNKTSSLALLSVDLDGFRRFNNLNGYYAGDKIVKELARRLQALAPGLISRLGNDEFMLLLEAEADEDIQHKATLLCYQILHTLTEPYRYKELEVILPCSIGVSMAPEHSLEVDTLINQSVQARLKAKEQSSCSYIFYTQQLHERSRNPLSLEPELMDAIRRTEFLLYYQPRVDISSGKIVGAEALIRWQHPEKGLISPGDFIPIAERTGLIVPIGYWVIQQAGLDIQVLKDAGLPITHISVNLSFRQFQDNYLCRTIQRIIEKGDIDTSILEFELTESALFNNELHVKQGIEELNKLGINFSLDDFGTGYSSFSLLQKLPISSMKIDRSFISDVNVNHDNREIVKALINLARSLKKEIIAEGVETLEQLNFLASYGCDQAQGFLYSKPVPFEQFIALVEKQERSTEDYYANL